MDALEEQHPELKEKGVAKDDTYADMISDRIPTRLLVNPWPKIYNETWTLELNELMEVGNINRTLKEARTSV